MKKIAKNIIFTLISILIILYVVFRIYAADYYRAFDGVESDYINDTQVEIIGDYSYMYPTQENGVVLVFYPGGKVEHFAYYPMLKELTKRGYTIALVEMPYNLAFLGQDKASEAIETLVGYDRYYIVGHSLGGAMASVYAEKNTDKIDGLIVLGAYVYGEYPIKDSLTIYGTFNSNLEKNIEYDENIVIIEGGNHAQFGNYGPQKGDPDATITAIEQQRITIEAIEEFIKGNE